MQEELEAERRKRKRAELAESKREERQIELQAALAREVEATHRGSPDADAAQRDDASAAAELHEREQPLQLSFAANGASADRAGDAERPSKVHRGSLFEQAQPASQGGRTNGGNEADGDGLRKRSKVDELMHAEKERRERSAAAAASASAPKGSGGGSNTGPWLARGITVKVMAEHLEDYHRKKGVVLAVIDGYVAEVEMMDSGDVLRIDQAELETVRKRYACLQL